MFRKIVQRYVERDLNDDVITNLLLTPEIGPTDEEF